VNAKINAVYGRVSEADDKATSSVPDQLKAGRAFAMSQWQDTPVECFQEVVTARNISGRPEFCRLLTMCAEDRIARIIVRDQDRLSRSDAVETLQCLALLQQHGVEAWQYRTGQQIRCDDPHSKLMTTLMAGVAAFEREITAARTRDKMREMRRSGLWTGGHVPIGYRLDASDGTKRLVPSEKAGAVLKVFQVAAETRSLSKAFQAARAAGLWTGKTSLQAALANPVYRGAWHTPDGYIEDHHAAIVDLETFTRAQATGSLPYDPRVRKIDRIYQLQGLVRCKHCGKMMTPKHAKHGEVRFHYYSCQRTVRGCPVKGLPAADFEEWAWQRLAELCQNPAILMAALDESERQWRERNAVVFAQVTELTKELKAATTRCDAIMDFADTFFRRGKQPPENVASRLEAVEAKIKELKRALAEAKAGTKAPDKPPADKFIRELRAVLSNGSAEPKRKQAVFQALVSEILVSDKGIEISLLDPAGQDVGLMDGTTGGYFAQRSSWLPEMDVLQTVLLQYRKASVGLRRRMTA